MPRHPKQAQYERTARHRQLLSMQAVAFGWTKLDTLDAYLTEDDQLVVIDKELKRYSTAAQAEDLLSPTEPEAAIVTPADVPEAEFGPRWQRARKNMAKALLDGGALDFQATDRAELLSNLETVAASFLRGVQLLRENSGPDWREALGITEGDV